MNKYYTLILSISLLGTAHAKNQFDYQTSFEVKEIGNMLTFSTSKSLEGYLHGFGYASEHLALTERSPLGGGTYSLTYSIPKDIINFKATSKNRDSFSDTFGHTGSTPTELLNQDCQCINTGSKDFPLCIKAEYAAKGDWQFNSVHNPDTPQKNSTLVTQREYLCTKTYRVQDPNSSDYGKVFNSKDNLKIYKSSEFSCTPPTEDKLTSDTDKSSVRYTLGKTIKPTCVYDGYLTAIVIASPSMGDRTQNKSCDLMADPIDIATGFVHESVTDYRSRWAFPLIISRFYSSNTGKWLFNYSQHLNILTTGIQAVRSNGDKYQFTQEGYSYKGLYGAVGELKLVQPSPTDIQLIYYLPNGSIETYSASSGKLLKVSNREGLSLAISYPSSQEKIIQDQFGHQVIIHNENNQPESIQLPNGKVIKYQYEGNLLSKVTYPNGSTLHYNYIHQGDTDLLTGIHDGTGNLVASWKYSNNLAISNNQSQ
ncbi:DUF6531 domain-containing protein [Piscirickettsia litoralis]|uniref:DUF6531 domain-containing protein n=1 Tax=Piscirickettsia litoralis TaxID=1891921 RepID=A0ABX2ZXS3_9GAMM|nr:DUF6531 domain-containing protein [Piscirickettsia litoralis]ODN41416.1 hypothetical protein BGC07_16770 [Piscirickettsia litoralis]